LGSIEKRCMEKVPSDLKIPYIRPLWPLAWKKEKSELLWRCQKKRLKH